jgi:hypothetical protein
MRAARWLTFLGIPLLVVGDARAGAAQAAQAGERLGEVHFPVSCGAEAQPQFDRAVALLHHMTYARARAEFTSIAAAHPQCAMAHWGIAMTLFQPL